MAKNSGAKSRFRLQTTTPSSGPENQGENSTDTNIFISPTACDPDGFSSPPETFVRPSEEEIKDASYKPPFLHYGDVPLIELRRACILLTSSVCVRMR